MKWFVLSVFAVSSVFAVEGLVNPEVSMAMPKESAALPQKQCVEQPPKEEKCCPAPKCCPPPKKEECAPPPPKCCPPKKKKCPPPPKCCPPKPKKCEKPSRCEECTKNPNQPKCKSAARKAVEGA